MACSGKPCRQSANLTPVPCSSTSKRSPLASTNLVCISGIQHIDLIRQYRGAGIDLLINGGRNDGRDPCTFRLGCHAPLGLTADAERPPAEEIMSIGGAHGARRGTGPTYLDCPFSRGVLYLILQNRISRGSGSPEIKLHRRGR